MPFADFERFREKVLSDPALQEKLRKTVDSKEFAALVVETGRENGFEFNADDVAEAMRGSLSGWLLRWI